MEIPAGSAPAVVLTYGLASSLYHRLVGRARQYRLSGINDEPSWDAAVRKVADLYIPLGPFNWLEYGLSRASDAVSAQAALDSRALLLARELGAALGSVAEDYERRLWQEDRAALDVVVHDLAGHLQPAKDKLITSLAFELGLDVGDAPFEVTLVPRCHEPTGAYSHPTVIGIDRFRGTSLIEVLLHEVGHVAASRRLPSEAKGGFPAIRSACSRLGQDSRVALEMFHLLLFHATGQLVRLTVDPEYTPFAVDRRVYHGIAAKLGTKLTEREVEEIWSHRRRGEIDLDTAVRQLVTIMEANREAPKQRMSKND